MDSDREKLLAALHEIGNGSRRSKISRLREIFDEVEAAKRKGASNKAIVAGLAEVGLVFDVNNFKNARSRILKERALEALSRSKSDSCATGPTASSTTLETTRGKLISENHSHDPLQENSVASVKERIRDRGSGTAGMTEASRIEAIQRKKAEERRNKRK